jgi:serine/threonine-protein kinase
VIATLASVSSVPLVLGFVIANNDVPGVTPQKFFFGLVFPYILVAVMAYVGARVIYALGKEVTRARELGGYRLVERLGAGGMGEVWRAEHHLLARPAAIKLVRPEFLDDFGTRSHRKFQERFGREAQATALMRSPHTIELYDFGVANDGTFYYVMELLDGFDLETLVTRFGPIPAERAIHLLIQMCHSLGEAHEHMLIHRDIKPANVYICRYGREVDFVKVLDFGMVKSQREGEDTQQLTGDHMVPGTPAFMAPEQVVGSRLIDGRTDLYAVGCLAYWLVTGQLVFTGRTAIETMVQHTQAIPVPPSARTELEIPPALDSIILACLAKNPNDRPASADALAEALGSITMRSSWTIARAHEWWDRHHPVASHPRIPVQAVS